MTTTDHPLTQLDLKHLEEDWNELQQPCDSPDCETRDENGDLTWPECDCHSSRTVTLSNGYAEVWADGDVVQYGLIVANVAD